MNFDELKKAVLDLSPDDRLRLMQDVGPELCKSMMANPGAMPQMMAAMMGMHGPSGVKPAAASGSASSSPGHPDGDIRDKVRQAYAGVAQSRSSCCSPAASCCDAQPHVMTDHPVPEAELGLSCGNPLAFGYIDEGDVVLDLGSGAGKDVFLAARKVGATGRAIGVDMTPEMIALAQRNTKAFKEVAGLDNVEFHQGHIEDLPIDDASIDVAISNCVINLSPDKPKVFREICRVLKPGGRTIVSDIVLNRPLPEPLRESVSLYASCIAGALQRGDYLQAIRDAGFGRVELLDDRLWKTSDALDDPVTAKLAASVENLESLSGIASSITVLATP